MWSPRLFGVALMLLCVATMACAQGKSEDPSRNVAPGTKPPVEIGPPDLLKDVNFRQPYVQAIGGLSREPWLMQLDGPAPPILWKAEWRRGK